MSSAASTRTTGGNPMPVFFYDFNMPPRDDGLYWVPPLPSVLHHTGQEVIFGCQTDEVMARGVVREIAERMLLLELIEWLPCERFSGEEDDA